MTSRAAPRRQLSSRCEERFSGSSTSAALARSFRIHAAGNVKATVHGESPRIPTRQRPAVPAPNRDAAALGDGYPLLVIASLNDVAVRIGEVETLRSPPLGP